LDAAKDMIKIVHFACRIEISKRRIPNLILFIDNMMKSDRLAKFGHFSAQSLFAFVKIIG
jgi:hypothetical protein